jgi:transaldolase
LARPAWANVFMGRINAFVADNKLGDGRNAGEKATLASQRVLRRLRKSPGVEVRQIGASMRSGQQCFDLLGLDVFTMPVAAAQEFIASNPPAAELRDRTQADPPVTFATGVDADGDRLDCFWRVAAGFEQAMCKLLATDLDALTPSTLTAFLAEHGARDLFPVFSPTERQALAKDGKIPVYKTWGDKVRKGEAGWDGILTAAALASFAQDQRALDERIERLL